MLDLINNGVYENFRTIVYSAGDGIFYSLNVIQG